MGEGSFCFAHIIMIARMKRISLLVGMISFCWIRLFCFVLFLSLVVVGEIKEGIRRKGLKEGCVRKTTV